MPRKTPEEDIKRFESFLDGMEDIEYQYFLDYEASAKQKELAAKLREVEGPSFDIRTDVLKDALRQFLH